MQLDEFDFYQNRDSGQLWLGDRRLLWNTIRDLKPVTCAETGTWRGGGSTFFILNALRRNHVEGNPKPLLYSVEANPVMHACAAGDYKHRWKNLAEYMCLTLGDSCETYGKLLKDVTLDFCLLDGGETVTSPEFDLLAPKVRVGGVLMVHDWHNGKFVKALDDQAKDGIWELSVFGTGTGNFEEGSVGFAKAIKLR